MKKTRGFLLAAGIGLALAFTFSCSGDDCEPGGGNTPGGGGGNTFADSRDGKTYKNVTIGEQVWFAENLNYNASGSKCYGEDGEVVDICDEDLENCTSITLSSSEVQANCAKYGRLYDWLTALKVCPPGWHFTRLFEETRFGGSQHDFHRMELGRCHICSQGRGRGTLKVLELVKQGYKPAEIEKMILT